MMNSEHPRHPSSYHLKELVHTTRTARLAVIDALAQQYQRMLPVLEHKEPLHLLPGSFPTSPKLRPTHDVILHEHKTERVEEHHSSARGPHHSGHTPSADLFCFYARNLQRTSSLPLADTFKTGGSGCCPYCHTHISSRPNKAWEMVKEDERHKGHDRVFLVGARFLVKSHRPGGGYACVLCSHYKDADTVCGEIRALVEHLWKEHSCAELDAEEDIKVES